LRRGPCRSWVGRAASVSSRSPARIASCSIKISNSSRRRAPGTGARPRCTMIDPSLIDPGEQLIWQGKPYAGRYALRKAAYTFPFGIVFFGFSLAGIYSAYMAQDKATNQLGSPFWLFVIPFVIIGACMVLSPAWYFFRATATTYVLTDRRAIMDISGPFPRRISVPLNQVPFVDVRSSNQGPGHVLFQEGTRYYGNGEGMTQRDGFIAIADAAKVGQMLRSAIQKSTGAPPRS